MQKEGSSHEVRRTRASMLRDRAMAAAMAHLPLPVRWVMLLGGQRGLSTKEIANLSGVSLMTVRAMQIRGHKLIDAELQALV